jgi:hypothetical protein
MDTRARPHVQPLVAAVVGFVVRGREPGVVVFQLHEGAW